jgi:ubiquinone/menaquinone biosynthesis C-methylase UbiE
MPDLSTKNPLERFTGLAEVYARCRPDYPATALDFILDHCHLGSGALLVDVGSGTGISARQFAARGLQVIGIEPNADMRRQAEATPEHRDAIDYRAGRAEATGLDAAGADAVLAAQAFHWFDAPVALAEFRRILRPAGWVVALGNERDETDAGTAAYGKIIGGTKEAAAVEGPRQKAAEAILQCPLFQHAVKRTFEHVQQIDEEGLLGRAFSASYAPREPAAVERFAADLQRVFAEFQRDGMFQLKYVTSVSLAQKYEPPGLSRRSDGPGDSTMRGG